MTKLTAKQQKLLKTNFEDLDFKQNFPLTKITYFQVGGPADLLVIIKDHQQLLDLVSFCHQEDIEFLVLGGASNVVVSDEGARKLVILTKNDSVQLLEKSAQTSTTHTADSMSSSKIIRAECGVRTSGLVKKTVDLGLTGLEPFMGLPGRLGGAVYNNSHFKDSLIGDFITQVEVINSNNEVKWLTNEECHFGYDSSRFQDTDEVILSAVFLLKNGNKDLSHKIINQTMSYRTSTQPLGMPSSGCIFKNVPNSEQLKKLFPQFSEQEFVSAGLLIDKAGLKGTTIGNIQVSHKHASFMVNLGDGTAADIKKLILKVKQEVFDKFGVQLEEEVFWLNEN